MFVVRDAAKQVFARLMDAVDPALVDTAERAAAAVTGVRDVDRVRMRWIGHRLHADLAVAVDDTLTIDAAHRLAHEVERHLAAAVPHLAAAVVHAEPATGAHEAHH